MEASDDNLSLVRADAGQLHQLIVNLVVNAFDATPGGGTVTVSARNAVAGGIPGVTLAIADTGSGIAPELHGKVFETFFTTKPQGQGTGLGLAICRDIVRAHAGTITLDTVPGAGTTFSAWLPAIAGERE
jgi:signal transduction histidine kinase